MFFIAVKFLRFGANAKALDKTVYDRNSTNILGFITIINGISIFIAPLLNFYHLAYINNLLLSWIGIFIMLFGSIVRIIAVYTLGEFYTMTLRSIKQHELITGGIYSKVRHPGYLGTILVFIGGDLAVQNWISLIVSLFLITVYIYRIRAEENMLMNLFNEKYLDYQKRTYKLFPYIY